MIPVFILAFRWGIKGGLLSGFLWGILQIATGNAYILNFCQGLIEYSLAFTVLGFAGVFAIPLQQAAINYKNAHLIRYIIVGILLYDTGRFNLLYIVS